MIEGEDEGKDEDSIHTTANSPKNVCYWAHTGLGMELMSNNDDMAASGVDLRLHNRFWKGKNRLQSWRENSRAPLFATSRATA